MREVAYARFHEVLEIPGIGNLGKVLPAPSKSLDLKMFHDPAGLLVKMGYRNQITGSSSYSELLVPWPNIIICKYVPDEPSPANIKTAA